MAEITVQGLDDNTNVALANADSGGDSFQNDGDVIPLIQNSSPSAMTVTFVAQRIAAGAPQGMTISDFDRTVSIGAGLGGWMRKLKPQIFNDSTGKVQVTYSDATSVGIGAIHTPRAR